jgi:hypothetical protein
VGDDRRPAPPAPGEDVQLVRQQVGTMFQVERSESTDRRGALVEAGVGVMMNVSVEQSTRRPADAPASRTAR